MANINAENYAAQGGTSWNVRGALKVHSSGVAEIDGDLQVDGQLDLESGSTLNVRTGGSLVARSSAVVDFSSGSVRFAPSIETTAANIENRGLSLVATTDAALHRFTLNAPVAGSLKYIFATTVNSSANRVVIQTTGAAVQFRLGATADRTLKIGQPVGVTLIGRTSTEWLVVGAVGSSALSDLTVAAAS